MSGPLLDFVIKDHAHFEMQRRQITENQVRLVLKSPEQVIKGTMERHIYQSRLWVEDR